MHRVAVQIDPVAEQLLAKPRLTVLGRERAASFVRRSCVEAVGQKSDQIRDRLRLEDDGIDARFDCLGLLRADSLANRLFGDVLRVETREIEMVSRVITGAGAVRAASGDAEAGLARLKYRRLPFAVAAAVADAPEV